MGRPSSFCIVLLMTCHGTGSVLSRHFSNSRTYSSGKRVGELAMNCPAPHHCHLRNEDLAQDSSLTNVCKPCVRSVHRKRLERWEDDLPSLMYVAPSFSKSFLSITCSSRRHVQALHR